ncbi:deoxyribonuclease gamma isoform X1 [Xenopus laevis]|uniref:Deoxyribonuclease n=2 Tax=Xenopus laevis TaxID=8355 RepID=A0A8J1KVW4_XENLA|nr:deoxyribonuclease gamma isoform X1 [Xenopus laevis]XP_041420903.1 deoxyribonuclease gamma isoform X1 [Xenopus laevis]
MKIAAFNARRFGVKKCSDPKVSAVITKIVARYDIIVILEVFDAKEKAAKKLVEQLNSCSDRARYNYILSTPLGRKEYKEQYLFVYREEQVKVKGTYQYEDMQHGDEDSFAREPFIVRFEAKQAAVKDFVLIPIHTTPKDSVQEIDELHDVYEHVKEKWGTENIILLGDFNADGSYVSNKKMKTIRLRTDPDLHWLIDDDTDTTAINTTDFSYDRIVVHSSILKHIVPNSAKPFNFQEEYKLSYEEVVAVSDHYPVEVELNPAKGIKRKKKKDEKQ